MAVLTVTSGCMNPGGHPPQQATGVVIAADGPSAAAVDRITLRTDDGRVLDLTVGALDLRNGGLPAPHLREHLVSGEPILASYYGTELVRYVDAPAAS